MSKVILLLCIFFVFASFVVSGSKAQQPPQCGIENKPEGGSMCGQKISGGCETAPHQYPWMVRLPTGCGGSLITARHVLTAKHCFYHSEVTSIIGEYVKVNVHNQNDPEDYEEVLIKDTAYLANPDDPGVNESDLGILILDTPVDLSKENIGTVCLPSSADKDYRGKQAIAMGWGMTHAGSDQSDVLKHVALTVDQKEDVEYELYTKVGLIDGTIQDPCAGDSGGPLIYKEDGISTVIGTVKNGGFDCEIGNNISDTSTWNKVTFLLDWIHSVIDE